MQMSTRRAAVAAAVGLCAAGALIADTSKAAAQAESHLLWGVNGHPLVSYPGVTFREQIDALSDLGVTSYRVDIGSREKASALRSLLDEAKPRGISILPVLAPAFDLNSGSAAALTKKAFDLAFGLVSEFKGQIRVWELGNELENYAIIQPCEKRDDGTQYDCTWGPAGGRSKLDYFGPRWEKVSAVLKGLLDGAHAADPSVRCAIGTAGWGHTGAFERMKADGLAWDISVWHMYGEDPEWAFKKLAEFGKPIWVTEFNNPKGSQTGEDTQTRGLLMAMSRQRELQKPYRVEAAYIYELLDEPYWGHGDEARMGLIKMKSGADGQWMSGERKPAFAAVRDEIERAGDLPPQTSVPQAGISRDCQLTPRPKAPRWTGVIGYAYCLVLGRESDGAGLGAWSARLAEGTKPERMVLEMLHGSEFIDSNRVNTLSATQYVTFVNRLLVGRDPDAALLGRVQGTNLENTAAPFERDLIDSKEFRERHPILFGDVAAGTVVATAVPAAPEVKRNCDLAVLKPPLEFERGQLLYSYCLVLGRWPDAYGKQTWLAEMRGGLTVESLLLKLLDSDEFETRFKVETMRNEEFVALLYRVLLDREPDSQAFNTYVSGLVTGAMSRSDLCQDILASDEFRKKRETLFRTAKLEDTRAELEHLRR